MLYILQFFCIILSFLFHANLQAQALTGSCSTVRVAIDVNWEPHVIANAQQYTGIAVSLVDKLFEELGLEVALTPATNSVNVINSLINGEIDILASLYPHNRYNKLLDVIYPGYMVDNIRVAVLAAKAEAIKQWSDLVGLQGTVFGLFSGNDGFAKNIMPLLELSYVEDKQTMLTSIYNNKVEYLVASASQLEYFLDKNNLLKKYKIIEKLEYKAVVHLGVASNSACSVYLPYLRKRIAELIEGYMIMDWQREYSKNKLIEHNSRYDYDEFESLL